MSQIITDPHVEEETIEISPKAIRAVDFMLKEFNKRGIPTDVKTEDILENKAAWDFVKFIFQGYLQLYPLEAHEWAESTQKEKAVEKSVQEMLKGETGRSLFSYPPRLHELLKVFFPDVKFHDKRVVRKFSKIAEGYVLTNYGI